MPFVENKIMNIWILTTKVSFREASMINNVIRFFSLVVDNIVTVLSQCCCYFQFKLISMILSENSTKKKNFTLSFKNK